MRRAPPARPALRGRCGKAAKWESRGERLRAFKADDVSVLGNCINARPCSVQGCVRLMRLRSRSDRLVAASQVPRKPRTVRSGSLFCICAAARAFSRLTCSSLGAEQPTTACNPRSSDCRPRPAVHVFVCVGACALLGAFVRALRATGAWAFGATAALQQGAAE